MPARDVRGPGDAAAIGGVVESPIEVSYGRRGQPGSPPSA